MKLGTSFQGKQVNAFIGAFCLFIIGISNTASAVVAKANGANEETKLLTSNGAEISFTVEEVPEDAEIRWDFGDGATSTARNPSHQYQIAADYTVAVTSRCAACMPIEERATVRVQIAKVELITPKGDPVLAPKASGQGQNEYTFSGASPATLSIHFKAQVFPPTADLNKIKGDVSFWIDAVGSPPTWSPQNPSGHSSVDGINLVATAVFSGLPSRNDAFGTKQVKLIFSDGPAETVTIEVFFPRDATNNPGGTSPNWFYYWKQVGCTTPNVIYSGPSNSYLWMEAPGMLRWDYNIAPAKDKILLYDEVVTSDSLYGVGKFLSGIDNFIGTCIHEQKHLEQISKADRLVANVGLDAFRYGWSWNQIKHNHYNRGPDGQWGRARYDDDANGIVDDAVMAPPFEPGHGDDTSLEHQGHSDWPNAWALPPPFSNQDPHPLEVEATHASDDAIDEHKFATQDWGDPGKQHQNLNVYDD